MAVGVVILALVIFAAVGAGWMFAVTVISAWFLMLMLLPPEDALDAGFVFMLVAFGVAVSVGLAQEGLGAVLPR